MLRVALEPQTKVMAAVRVLLLPMLMALVEVAGLVRWVAQEHQPLAAKEAMVLLPQLLAQA
jgi:hypothetical protein